MESPPRTPLTLQVTAVSVVPETVAEKFAVVPSASVTVEGETRTAMSEEVMVRLEEAALDGSAAGVAVTVTVPEEGGDDGAVYVAVALEPTIVPHADPEQSGPETDQLMAVSGFDPEAGTNEAVKVPLDPAANDEGPLSENVKVLVTVTAAVELFEGSARLVAMRVTDGGVGRIRGAVKSPAEVTEPQAAPEQPGPFSTQLTARSGWPFEATDAWKARCAPNSTDALAGETFTRTSLMTVSEAETDLAGSATLVALTVTGFDAGRTCGAV